MPKGPRPFIRKCAQFVLPLVAIAVSQPRAQAQATAAAYKTADFSAFGGYMHDIPDWGTTGNNGASFGLNFTRYIRFPVSPSLEVRANIAPGQTVRENSYLVGVRGQATVLRKFHPYADFLIGTGNIHFYQPELTGRLGDNSIVYSIGGGVDYDLVRNFQAKVDFQYQHWNTGTNASLTPSLTIIGLAYRFSFGGHDRAQIIP
jgi:predicted porin